MLSLRNGNSFKTQHPFEKRRRESQNILYRYPSRVPIICELAGRDAPELKKKKIPRAERSGDDSVYVYH